MSWGSGKFLSCFTSRNQHYEQGSYSDRQAHTHSPNKRENRWLSSDGYLVVEASLLCFSGVFLIDLCVFLLLSYNNYCSYVTMDPKTSAKKSSEKKNKLITIEIKKKIIDKHEKGTRVVDLPNNSNPPPPPSLHRLPCTQIIPSLRYCILRLTRRCILEDAP